MTTAIYLIISGALIGAGVSLIWQDVRRRRRGSFVSEQDRRLAADMIPTDSDVEVTIARSVDLERRGRRAPGTLPDEEAPLPRLGLSEPAIAASSLSAQRPSQGVASGAQGLGHARPAAAEADPPRPAARLALEQEWAALQPAIAAGIERANAQLDPLQLFIGPVGEPSWGYKNKSYGAYRRLLLGGESVAWLKLELISNGRLRANVKAHREDRAVVNASSEIPAEDVGGEEVGALFSQCLKPAMAYARRQLSDSEKVASEQAWNSVDGLVTAALKATNGALAQAGARLTALAPAAWEGDLRRHRMALSVEVNGDDVARMHIERLPHEMEVAVGVPEPQLAALGRRRRIPVEGMTIHALAELMASCAWPAISRFRENRHQA